MPANTLEKLPEALAISNAPCAIMVAQCLPTQTHNLITGNNRSLKDAEKIKFARCIFLAIVALLCTASAADTYVSADGDDTAAGTADRVTGTRVND